MIDFMSVALDIVLLLVNTPAAMACVGLYLVLAFATVVRRTVRRSRSQRRSSAPPIPFMGRAGATP